MKLYLLKSLPFIFFVAFLVFVAYQDGRSNGYSAGLDRYVEKSKEDLKLHCYCGETRSCPFGGGVVGIQKCDTTKNQWLRCEPNLLYCDDVCKELLNQADASRTK